MNTKSNKKSQYTKKQLSETLIMLLDQFNYEEITILQICQYSNVSRASFYRNFNDKNAVLEFYLNSIIDQTYPDHNDPARMFMYSNESLKVWFDQKSLLAKLYKNDLFGIYTKVLNNVITEAYKRKVNNQTDLLYEYLATEMAYIISSIFYKWAERDFKETLEEMDDLLKRLHSSRANREFH